MATAHNAAKAGEIAGTVLMPGDPLRAKHVAENYLTEVFCFNTVRNMLGYTGMYKGKRISVMGSGMGMPSMGIYAYELYHFYGVENILRIGSAGGLQEDIGLKDVVLAMGACTDSRYAYQYQLPGTFAPIADFGLLEKAAAEARARGSRVRVGNVVSTDIFYNAYGDAGRKWASMGVLCVDMETAALYMNAAAAGKRALALLSISDHLFTEGELSAHERETGFSEMIGIALGTAVSEDCGRRASGQVSMEEGMSYGQGSAAQEDASIDPFHYHTISIVEADGKKTMLYGNQLEPYDPERFFQEEKGELGKYGEKYTLVAETWRWLSDVAEGEPMSSQSYQVG